MAFGKPKTVLVVVGKQRKAIAYLTRHLSIAGNSILPARIGARRHKGHKEHAPEGVLVEIDLSDMEGMVS